MNRHLRALPLTIAAAAVIQLAAPAPPATAQVRVRDHRRRKPAPRLQVDGFSPERGTPGTRVTIRGRGFTPATRVIFGLSAIKPLSVRPNAIVIRIPNAGSQQGDGTITLRHPGRARDLVVGQFIVELPITITSVAPSSGIVGTRIVIKGAGFHPGMRVALAGVELPVARVTPRSLFVTIAAGARTGSISVSHGDRAGKPVQAPRIFRVVTPAPNVTALAPTGGPPGTTVRVNATNIEESTRALYGRRPAVIAERGPGFVRIVVPPDAGASRFIWLRGAAGAGRSKIKFRLQQVPIISAVKPRAGIVGERIDIAGRNFRAGDRFSIGGRSMRILRMQQKRVSVVIPRDATSGPIEVRRGGYRGRSAVLLDVLYQPVISGIRPIGGAPGVEVVLRGRHFDSGMTVRFGGKKLRVTPLGLLANGVERVAVRVPANATDDSFELTTRGGVARSAHFRVHYYPIVTASRPARGLTGSKVTLRGKNMRFVQQVLLGNKPQRIIAQTRGKLVLEIDRASPSGTFTVVAFGRSIDTGRRFDVTPAPLIDSFEPRAGVPGSEVVITGRHLRRSTMAWLGNKRLTVLRVVPGRQLTVLIPKRARSNQFFVGEGDVLVGSGTPFIVISPPRLRQFVPRVVHPGDDVRIDGDNLNPSTVVLWAGHALPVIARRGSRQLVIRVPSKTAGGSYPLVLVEGGVQVSTSRYPLTVRSPPPPVKVRDHRKRR